MVVEWQEVLANCTADEITHGLETWDSEFPPNVMQFRTRCKTNDTWQHKSAAYKPFPKALPKPKSKESVVNKAFAKMRQVIKQIPEREKKEIEPIAADEESFFGDRPYKNRQRERGYETK